MGAKVLAHTDRVTGVEVASPAILVRIRILNGIGLQFTMSLKGLPASESQLA